MSNEATKRSLESDEDEYNKKSKTNLDESKETSNSKETSPQKDESAKEEPEKKSSTATICGFPYVIDYL